MKAKVDRVTLNYELVGEGEAVALIHGLGGDWSTWERQLPAFSHRYRVLAWDVRGFGQSQKIKRPITPALFARDLRRLLKHLGIDKAVIIGHSMGGVIALQFALDYPQATRALIPFNTSSECNEAAFQWYDGLAHAALKGGMATVPQVPERAFSAEFVSKNPEEVSRYRQRLLGNDPSSYAQAARAMGFLRDVPLTPNLSRIACPTLIIVGDKDAYTPPGGSVIMHRSIPGSELVILKGIGHSPQQECPEAFNKIVLDFLARLP